MGGCDGVCDVSGGGEFLGSLGNDSYVRPFSS